MRPCRLQLASACDSRRASAPERPPIFPSDVPPVTNARRPPGGTPGTVLIEPRRVEDARGRAPEVGERRERAAIDRDPTAIANPVVATPSATLRPSSYVRPASARRCASGVWNVSLCSDEYEPPARPKRARAQQLAIRRRHHLERHLEGVVRVEPHQVAQQHAVHAESRVPASRGSAPAAMTKTNTTLVTIRLPLGSRAPRRLCVSG